MSIAEVLKLLGMGLLGIVVAHLVRRVERLEQERNRHQRCLERIDAWMDLADEELNEAQRRRKAARNYESTGE